MFHQNDHAVEKVVVGDYTGWFKRYKLFLIFYVRNKSSLVMFWLLFMIIL